ncbi:DUF6283 family protein [Streptomyces caatingaensis]|uniref:Uncharacterized protein n=1 Tax=Streptomyces caatingaensis TaxID=1678637 RepID=A0A0K9XJP7_9ACTN|nr:DUF6283 family protein [Streptomyces caatingaensis]KNB52882.1 hypothetical protein AC230_09630 [Streptomyces caatingaensis]
MGEARDHRNYPCVRCPWRRDVDLAEFSDGDMETLRRANGRSGAEAPRDAPVVACHLDKPGTSHAYRWCAGWLAVAGPYHLSIRLAVLFESLPGGALAPRPGWPRLYASLEELLKARARQLHEG